MLERGETERKSLREREKKRERKVIVQLLDPRHKLTVLSNLLNNNNNNKNNGGRTRAHLKE